MIEPALGPSADSAARYGEVVIAGHRGDLALIERHLDDPDGLVRQAALGGLARLDRLGADRVRIAMVDPDPVVRRRAAELSIFVAGVDPIELLDDAEASVVEVASYACGEIDWADRAPVAKLCAVTTGHGDALCREAAAAALGAIGHPAGLDAVLMACRDRVTVRRRATLALAAFDDPRADEALRVALEDKDWQVRQAAEDLLEVGRVLEESASPSAKLSTGTSP